jgi:uncharacterized membrane protein YdjX (TVP38/TMEM64 family)
VKRRAIVAIAVIAAVTALVLAWPMRGSLGAMLTWIDTHRRISAVIFVALYIGCTVAVIPGLVLTLAAGAIFGLFQGTALVSLGSVGGATAAFFVGRTVARDWVRAKISGWPRFRALDRTLAQRGFWIVLLTRLSPAFPFVLLNYAYGVSSVRATPYILASWVGMLPATLLYVYAGSVAASVTQAISGEVQLGAGRWWLLGTGFAATLVVTVLVARIARRNLDAELKRAPVAAAGSGTP